MGSRCVMQVETDRNASPGRPVHRFFESVADFLSPPVKCDACGNECKQRRCKQSGAVRPIDQGETWAGGVIYEIEYLCPACGGSIWMPEASTYYYPMG